MFRLSTLTLGCLLLANSVSAAEKPPSTKQLTAIIEASMRKDQGTRNGKLLKIHGVESIKGAMYYHDDVANGVGGWLPFPPGRAVDLDTSDWAVKIDFENDIGFGERAIGQVIVLIHGNEVVKLINPKHFRIGK